MCREGLKAVCWLYVPRLSLQPSDLVACRQAERDLDWRPEFSLVDGLRDSYEKDFGRGNFRKAADFATDDKILEKVKGKVPVAA